MIKLEGMSPETIINTYFGFIIFIFGLIMGSFLNCAGYRFVTGESIMKGRSHCDNCGHTLGALDLVPVLSYIFLKGKCRYCGKKMSIVYPLSEILCAVLYLIIFLYFGLSIKTLELLILVSIMYCLSISDINGFIIPDILIVLGIINKVIFTAIGSTSLIKDLLFLLLKGLTISLPLVIIVTIMEKILKKEAMGGGDIKLFFMLGLYFSPLVQLLGVFMSCVIGLIFGLLYTKKVDKVFPFGPSICMAYYFCILYGDTLVNLYLSLF